MPRQRGGTALAVHDGALVASAARYTGKSPRIFMPREAWQSECYRHYRICGEARFAARYMGHALSRATLHTATLTEGQLVRDTSGPAYEHLQVLFNGRDGQAQMLEQIGVHFTIAGECYLVGRKIKSEFRRPDDPPNGTEVWEIVSVMEMQVNGNTWSIRYNDGLPPIVLGEDEVVVRIWIPDPEEKVRADSPFRSLLPTLTEIEWLTRHIFSQVSSRLAGAGLLLLPNDITFPPPPPINGKEQKPANEADAFMMTLADAMMTVVEDPSNPMALVPLVAMVNPDSVDKVKLLHFWSNLDEQSIPMRQESIRRFALGLDMPQEQMMGMSSNPGTGGGNSNGVSHWGAWQIEESTIKMFVEPALDNVANAVRTGYVLPAVDDPTKFVIHDTTGLKLRPDRSKESMELNQAGLLKDLKTVEANGFTKDDMMDPEEQKLWLLRKIASGSNTPEQVAGAAKALGVDLPTTPAALPAPAVREAPSPPSLEDHPTRPATPEAAALLPAAEALVFRALERAGNRIRQKFDLSVPGVRAFEMHTLVEVNGDAKDFMNDAWSCAPDVLEGVASDPAKVIRILNSYCLSLIAAKAPHDRERLARWLEKAT